MIRRPGRRDRGGASLELVILAPFLLALGLLIVAFARFTQAKSVVDQAARDGARAATSQNSRRGVDPAVAAAVSDALSHAPSSCRQTAEPHTEMSKGAFSNAAEDTRRADPDQVETVTVTVSCYVDLGDLAIISLGRPKYVHFTFTSPLDKWRGYRS